MPVGATFEFTMQWQIFIIFEISKKEKNLSERSRDTETDNIIEKNELKGKKLQKRRKKIPIFFYRFWFHLELFTVQF